MGGGNPGSHACVRAALGTCGNSEGMKKSLSVMTGSFVARTSKLSDPVPEFLLKYN